MDTFLQSLQNLPAILTRLELQLDANTKALNEAIEMLGNTRLYERDAATYLHVEPKTMFSYRQRGLPYEKVGRVISYLRKDLDAWRASGKVRHVSAV